MHISEWLGIYVRRLIMSGNTTARLDCLILLEDATGKDRGWLLAHPEYELDENQVKKLDAQIKRRAAHEPLAYIRNKSEFYGREFYVDDRVLVPRPESEAMIELLKQLTINDERLTINDIGTGSGALAITAKLELPKAKVIATDIDPACLTVAKKNAQKLGAKILFVEGDLLDPLPTEESNLTAILANLPYVPNNFQINSAAMNEPRTAIFGGSDGLNVYRKLFLQLKQYSSKPQFVLTESMPPQHEKLAKIATSSGFRLLKIDDFIQVFTSI